MRNPGGIDVPQLGQFGYVLVVAPVAKRRQAAVGAALPGVLRGGLSVHLQNTGTGATQHAANEVEVVDLSRRRSRLVGLIEALQHRRQQTLGLPENLGGAPKIPSRDVTDLCHVFRRIICNAGRQLVESDGVGVDVVVVHPVVRDHLVQQAVHQCQIGTGNRCQMHRRRFGDLGFARVDAEDLRCVGPGQAVQHA